MEATAKAAPQLRFEIPRLAITVVMPHDYATLEKPATAKLPENARYLTKGQFGLLGGNDAWFATYSGKSFWVADGGDAPRAYFIGPDRAVTVERSIPHDKLARVAYVIEDAAEMQRVLTGSYRSQDPE